MKNTAAQLKVKLIDIYEEWGWDFYDQFSSGHAYDAFKLCLTEPDFVFGKVTSISPEHREVLLSNIKKKLAATPIKLRCTFNLLCFTFQGIEAVRASLEAAKEKT